MNCEGWSNGATKLGWAVQIEQSAEMTRWVSGLGMRQLMVVWVLGSKMGLSRVGVGNGVMRGQRRHGVGSTVARWVFHFFCLASPFLFFSFFFFSFMSGFSIWFWSLTMLGFLFFSFFFFFSSLHFF